MGNRIIHKMGFLKAKSMILPKPRYPVPNALTTIKAVVTFNNKETTYLIY